MYTVRISSVVNFPRSYPAELVAVSPNYLDVAYGEYFVTQYTGDSQALKTPKHTPTDGCTSPGPSPREPQKDRQPSPADGCTGLDCVRLLDSPYDTAVSPSRSASRISILSEPASDRGCSETEKGCTNVPPSLSGAREFTALVPASLGDAIQAQIGSVLSLVMVCQSQR